MSTNTASIEYEIYTDRDRLDIDVIHGFLVRSYWSHGVPRDIVARAIRHSLCFGIDHRRVQVGFARLVTDRATFAYLADVFILEEHRGIGLAKRLMGAILAHADLQGLRRLLLGTRDAHGLYEQFGFRALANPGRMMEIIRPDTYRTSSAVGHELHARATLPEEPCIRS